MRSVAPRSYKEDAVALTAEEKQDIIAKYATHEGDTGSPEVQIALLTKRIADLTEHLKFQIGRASCRERV